MRPSSLLIALTASLLMGTSTITACNRGAHGQAERPEVARPWTGLTADVRAVWSAEPGIDLLTAPAVVVRAYIESYYQAKDLGNIDVAYPGFTKAVTPNPPQGDPPIDHPWPDTSEPAPYPIQGTDKYRILRIDTSGAEVTAVVCDYSTYTSAFSQSDGTFGYVPGAADDGVGVLLITMSSPTKPAKPIPPQRGPSAAPTTDVFNGWLVKGFLSGSQFLLDDPTPPQWPTKAADAQACRDRAPDPAERRKFLRRGTHPRSDYPTLPPYPGWPEADPA